MKHLASAAFLVLLAAALSSDAQARPTGAGTQGAGPVRRAAGRAAAACQLLPGMGTTKNFLTTKSEDARMFVLQGVSQIHSFWFRSRSGRASGAGADPNMAMAHWCIALSAAGDYRPAFQLLRDPASGGARRGAAGGPGCGHAHDQRRDRRSADPRA
jgi:hypothetical protein